MYGKAFFRGRFKISLNKFEKLFNMLKQINKEFLKMHVLKCFIFRLSA